ncbi:MAG: 1-deoxy-D-xylulose-5-phosphate reductoisomerase [Treponema sp.]|jgi:1-deoxy-D-xylulose-5-phosphate reductoisomerase|nr:1-deoxy-D-xylulose-5-phosphate reductoisomerase [Treponema sp.]
MKKRVAVLGASGSIGKSALEVIALGKNDFEIVLLSSHSREKELAELGRQWPAAKTVLSGAQNGREALLAAIADCGADIALNGISGAAGLEPSMAAIESGANLALANKETLVMAGPLVFQKAREKKVDIIPVDSEHAAVFHLLEAHGRCPRSKNFTTENTEFHGERDNDISKLRVAPCTPWSNILLRQPYDNLEEIILTASGGPFRNYSIEEMKNVSPQEALAHPTWNMGAKITIDSASMANKGLEVIEAAQLFNLAPEKIKVAIHPQSIVHSMIRMKDGAVYAQLSRPDMRLPIHQALHWPQTVPANEFGRLEFDSLTLEFCQPDTQKFPLLGLAYEAAKKGGLYPCAYNAANEAGAAAFLGGRIGFLDIGRITGYVLDKDWSGEPADIASVMEADRQARIMAEKETEC